MHDSLTLRSKTVFAKSRAKSTEENKIDPVLMALYGGGIMSISGHQSANGSVFVQFLNVYYGCIYKKQKLL